MACIGILLGLTAAFLQSVCYIVSGSYVRRVGMAGWTLTSPQRALMTVPYAALAWFCRPASLGEEGIAVGTGVLMCTVMAFLGDVGLFQMQKTVEPSRVAPLQSMKIPLIALISFLAFGHAYSPLQLAGIALVIASSVVLVGAGCRLTAAAWGWLLACAGGFAVSDIGVGLALTHARDVCGGVLKSSLFVLGAAGLGSSLLAFPLLAVQHTTGTLPPRRAWLKYALPYGSLWLIAMILLFICFSLSGIVPGTIAQSPRGLISVALGWALARHGFADIETETSPAVFVRRALAAVLIMVALAFYAI